MKIAAAENVVRCIDHLFTKAKSRAAKYSCFVDRCKANMHVSLCMSPIGEAFRGRSMVGGDPQTS